MELNIFPASPPYMSGKVSEWRAIRNERLQTEMKILKARQLAGSGDDTTRERLEALAAELEQKLREIDE